MHQPYSDHRSLLVSENGPSHRWRLAILTSHVIQYQGPLFQAMAAHPDLDIRVFFCSNCGSSPHKDRDFGQEFSWDIDLTSGYESIVLPNFSVRPNPSRFLGTLNPGIIAHLRKAKFDALLVHGWAHATNWMAMIGAFAVGIPVLMRAESTLLQPVTSGKKLIKSVILRTLFSYVSAFLTTGSRNEDFYKSFGVSPERMFRVPYSVNNKFFQARDAERHGRRSDIRLRLGLPRDRPIILFSGKLIGRKRPFDVIKALYRLRGRCDAAILFIGDGMLRKEILKQAQSAGLDEVYLPGFKNQTELADYFVASDIFVLTSDFEPWGLVINEAMCFGLPIIASDRVGAAADLVRNGRNGFIYPAGDVVALSASIHSLVINPGLRRQMGDQSREIISSWNYDTDVQQIIEAIRWILSKSPESLSSVAS